MTASGGKMDWQVLIGFVKKTSAPTIIMCAVLYGAYVMHTTLVVPLANELTTSHSSFIQLLEVQVKESKEASRLNGVALERNYEQMKNLEQIVRDLKTDVHDLNKELSQKDRRTP